MLLEDRDILRFLDIETTPYLNELYPDFLYGSKEILFFNEDNNTSELLFEELLAQLSKYGTTQKIVRMFTSQKKKKNISVYHFYPLKQYAESNPIHKVGKNFQMISSSNLKFEDTEIKNTDATELTGSKTRLFFKDLIEVPQNNRIDMNVYVKNVGLCDTRVYVGYAVYNTNKERVWMECYPYNNSYSILRVLNANEGNTITVAPSTFDYEKGCKIALYAKSDLSDIPNLNLISGSILETRKQEDGSIEIQLTSPIEKSIPMDTPIRITNKAGSPFVCVNEDILSPGEERFFKSAIARYDTYHSYTNKALSFGIEYIKPLIFSISLDNTQNNTIQFQNWNVRY